MKKRLLFGMTLLLLLVIVIYGAVNTGSFNPPNLKSSIANNYLIIDDISAKNNKGVQEVTVTATTDWQGLYPEFDEDTNKKLEAITSTKDRALARIELMKKSLELQVTKDVIQNSLKPETDETTSSGSFIILNDVFNDGNPSHKMAEYAINRKNDKMPINISTSSGFTVSAEADANTIPQSKYDFVFIVGINHLENQAVPGSSTSETDGTALRNTVHNSLNNFIDYLSTESALGFRANIIEIGGEKATEKSSQSDKAIVSVRPYGDSTTIPDYSAWDGYIISKDNYTYNSTGSSITSDATRKIILPLSSLNTSVPNGNFPQEVFYTDAKVTNDSKSYYIQGYTDWFTDKAKFENAISLLGINNTLGSSLKESGGTNTAWGLYEAIEFIKNKKIPDDTKRKVIVLITNQNFDVSAESLKFLPSNYTKDKIGFESWITKEIKENNILIMASIMLGETDPGANVDYTGGKVDRLGRPVTDAWNGGANSYYTSNLRKILGENFLEYEGSKKDTTNRFILQTFLEENLFDFICRANLKQTWTIKYSSPLSDIYDMWKKLLFSLDKVILNKVNLNTPTDVVLNPITILKKNKNAPEYVSYNNKSASDIPETYVDRYYYVPDPVLLNFINPHAATKKWKLSTEGISSLDFNFTKLDGKTKPSTVITVNSISVFNPADGKTLLLPLKTLNTSVGNSYEFKQVFSPEEINTLREFVKNLATKEIIFSVSWKYGNISETTDIKALVDFDAPTVNEVTIQNIAAKNVLMALKNPDGTDIMNEAEIDNLTTANANKILYVRDIIAKNKDNYTNLSFKLNDSNFPQTTQGTIDLTYIKSLEDKIKSSFVSNFTSSLTVTGKQKSPTEIEFTITGGVLKDAVFSDNKFSSNGHFIEDDFGNATTLKGLGIRVIPLKDPVPVAISLTPSQVIEGKETDSVAKKLASVNADGNGSQSDNPLYSFIKSSLGEYNLTFTKPDAAYDEIVILLAPFTQDRSKADMVKSSFGKELIKDKLSYQTFRAYNGSVVANEQITTSNYVTSLKFKTKDYDGLYGISLVYPINRAGGISGITYATSTSDVSSDAASISSTKTSVESGLTVKYPNGFTGTYVVDNIAPTIGIIKKTKVNFSSFNGTSISLLNGLSDSKKSLFLGENKPGKFGDEFDIYQKDKYLKPSSAAIINVDNVSNGVTLIDGVQKIKWTDSVSTQNLNKFITQDLSANTDITTNIFIQKDNNNTEVLTPKLTLIENTDLSKGGKTLKNGNIPLGYFTRSSLEIFRKTAYAALVSAGSYIKKDIDTTQIINITGLFGTPVTFGPKPIKAYSFSEGGWVNASTETIIWDNGVHDSNPNIENFSLSNRVILSKKENGKFEGSIDLSNILEYSGLISINSVTSSKGVVSSYVSSILSIPTADSVPIASNSKLSIVMEYTGVPPISHLIVFRAKDRLGNERNFVLEATVINNTKIIGASKNEKKIIESKVGLSSNKKTNIKSTKQTTQN